MLKTRLALSFGNSTPDTAPDVLSQLTAQLLQVAHEVESLLNLKDNEVLVWGVDVFYRKEPGEPHLNATLNLCETGYAPAALGTLTKSNEAQSTMTSRATYQNISITLQDPKVKHDEGGGKSVAQQIADYISEQKE